ncbi:MAG: DUF2442 domain-containing protein [Adhaeribacter sp.]
MVISIDKAQYLDNYKIRFDFSDGISQVVDFEPFLKSAKNPMTKKYLDLDNFKSFTVKYGDITWNDYEMCFPIWDLHQGKI